MGIALASAASVAIVYIIHFFVQRRCVLLAFSLILGGTIGNCRDRLFHGRVTDFIMLHWHGWIFPIFNVADIGITTGAILVIIEVLFLSGEPWDDHPVFGTDSDSSARFLQSETVSDGEVIQRFDRERGSARPEAACA